MMDSLMFRQVLIVSLLVAVPLTAAPRHRAASTVPFPDCSMVMGSAAVTFTRNEGLTLAPTAESFQGLGYTYGLTAIDEKTLMALHRNQLLLSKDAGCSWREVAEIEGADFPPSLASGSDGRVYIWSDNRQWSARYDSRGLRILEQPQPFLGVAVDRDDPNVLRAGSHDGSSANGSIWESRDAGESWTPIGRPPQGTLLYRYAFNPSNLDHVIIGTLGQGAFVSRDGGRSWMQSTGIRGASGTNVFELVFSKVNANVVWAMGIDMAESNSDVPSHGRHIYLSTNGGESFRPVVDEQPGVKLINGPLLAPHPTDPNVLYFVFGTHFYDYGTDLFRYDASTNRLTLTHNTHDDINAITFSPKEPRVMYLGLESVR